MINFKNALKKLAKLMIEAVCAVLLFAVGSVFFVISLSAFLLFFVPFGFVAALGVLLGDDTGANLLLNFPVARYAEIAELTETHASLEPEDINFFPDTNWLWPKRVAFAVFSPIIAVGAAFCTSLLLPYRVYIQELFRAKDNQAQQARSELMQQALNEALNENSENTAPANTISYVPIGVVVPPTIFSQPLETSVRFPGKGYKISDFESQQETNSTPTNSERRPSV